MLFEVLNVPEDTQSQTLNHSLREVQIQAWAVYAFCRHSITTPETFQHCPRQYTPFEVLNGPEDAQSTLELPVSQNVPNAV